MRFGILGGTFDPPHKAHLALAKAAKAALSLDEVIFVPAARNPLKRTSHPTSAKHRLRMVELMVQDEEGLSVSDIDISRGGPSYAIDTVQEFMIARPGAYWFLMGADALKALPQWWHVEKFVRLCRIGAVVRMQMVPYDVMRTLPSYIVDAVDLVPMPPEPVSSSKIREMILRGQPVEHWLKPAVWEYIESNNLYQEQQTVDGNRESRADR